MTAVLDVQDLRLRRGTRDILDGVTFSMARGEIVALMGLSGAGKTTVLRVVAGLEDEEARAVKIDGRVGMVFQFHYLFEHLTVTENVTLAPTHVAHVAVAQARTRALELLEQLGIAHRASALPRELSGGEAQRAAIARALAMDPPLLLLDEPTASLDPARRGSLGELLGRLAADGRAILVTSHDVEFVREYATRVVVLADGKVVESGTARGVLDHPKHAATSALLQQKSPSQHQQKM